MGQRVTPGALLSVAFLSLLALIVYSWFIMAVTMDLAVSILVAAAVGPLFGKMLCKIFFTYTEVPA